MQVWHISGIQNTNWQAPVLVLCCRCTRFSQLPVRLEPSVKQVFYNTVALILVTLACSAAVAVLCILEAFLRSSLWAALCGMFFHSTARAIVVLVRGWLSGVQASCAPLVPPAVGLSFACLDLDAESSGPCGG